ncbi:tetratricopeptide repeat protein [Methanoregula sp.]|uniref:tetratricopeptide repeat protein n=1 Tax=Methanoregula sp. TaxID=2052170 RepID=UPI003BB0069D
MPDPANPDDPGVWFTAAIEYTHNQDYTNALRCFEKATELNPDFIDVWGRMGLLLVKLGRFEEARACDAHIRELNARVSEESRRLREVVETTNPSTGARMSSEKPLKSIWAAIAASAVCPGWGQVYNGEGYGKGWLILAGLFCSALAGTVLTVLEGTYLLSPVEPYFSVLPPLSLLLPVLVWLATIAGAAFTSRNINKRRVFFIEVSTGTLFMYPVITWLITAVLYLYLPMITSSFTSFLSPFR